MLQIYGSTSSYTVYMGKYFTQIVLEDDELSEFPGLNNVLRWVILETPV